MSLDKALKQDERIKTIMDDLYEKGYFINIDQLDDALDETTTVLVVKKRENDELLAIKPLANCKWADELNEKQYEIIVCRIKYDLQYLIDDPIHYPEGLAMTIFNRFAWREMLLED